MEGIIELAKFGLAGVSIALVVALVVIVKAVLKIVGNHMNHNTKALTELRDTNKRVANVVEKMCDKF